MRRVIVIKAFSSTGRVQGRTAAIAVAALVLSVAPDARAFERQWRVGGGAGIATLRGAPVGPALSLHGAYGLNDLFDVHLELLGSRHGREDGTDVLSASAGVSYKIDVFEWVPYFGLTAGYYNYRGAEGAGYETGSQAGAAIMGGLDHLFSRRFAMGVQLRSHASFADGFDFPYFSAVLRAEARWGW